MMALAVLWLDGTQPVCAGWCHLKTSEGPDAVSAPSLSLFLLGYLGVYPAPIVAALEVEVLA